LGNNPTELVYSLFNEEGWGTLRTRNAIIGAGVGLTALLWLVWLTIPHRSANPLPSVVTAPPSNVPEITFEIRQYPEDRQTWNRGDAIRVRLDIDRLRAHDLSLEDVKKAFVESSVVDSARQVDPPPGVVFVRGVTNRPDQYGNLIVRANADGELVRLRDIAKIEFVPADP
jgi:hypothetical protein